MNGKHNENVAVVQAAHSSRRFFWIDCIRFAAALMVLLCHFRGAFLPEYTCLPASQQNVLTFAFYALTRLGHEAVLIFFVLSGYLVGGRAIQKTLEGTFDVANYSIDRFVRIMLPLLSALILYIPCTFVCGRTIDWANWFGCLFSLQGIWTGACIEPLWSLAYEVWFYILIGAAMTLVFSPRRVIKIISFLCVVACLLVFTRLSAHYLFIWFLGAFCYIARRRGSSLETSRRHVGSLVALSLSLLFLLLMIPVLQLTSGGHISSDLLISLLPTQNRESLEILFAVAFCLTLQEIVWRKPQSRLAGWVDKTGTKLAAFSYTLYLIHILVMRVLQHFGVTRPESLSFFNMACYALWCLLAILSSYVVYCCFERNTYPVKVWLKKKLISR